MAMKRWYPRRAFATFHNRGALVLAMGLVVSLLVALAPAFQAGMTSSRGSSNACSSCHGSTYTEYVTVTNYNIPSQINVDQVLQVRTNISLSSTTYTAATANYYKADLTVTVFSTNGYSTIAGSPKSDKGLLPGTKKEYIFNMTGALAGSDTVKITASIKTQHNGATVSDPAQGNVQVNKVDFPPVLSAGTVSQAKGYASTVFFYNVTYKDPDGEAPSSITVSIDNGTGQSLNVADGKADTVKTGELYTLSVNGSTLGLGDHSFKFAASDPSATGIGDTNLHYGPTVLDWKAPMLLDATLSPAEGFNDTVFTYNVTYKDLQGEVPSTIWLSIDNGTAQALKVADGKADAMLSGERYTFTTDGAKLGKGGHSFKFGAKDTVMEAQGCNGMNYGPTVHWPSAPALLDGAVFPAKGYNLTTFTYNVTYMDPDGDLPVWVALVIDNGTPRNMSPADGLADTMRSGEVYTFSLLGSELGVGNHSFRFQGADMLFGATGRIDLQSGPWVRSAFVPNTPPEVTISKLAQGDKVQGLLNISGKASDADVGDTIHLVEVRMDSGQWARAQGGADWFILWDCSVMAAGAHTVYARAFDGTDRSKVVSVTISVETLVAEPPTVSIDAVLDLGNGLIQIDGTSAQGNNSVVVDDILLSVERSVTVAHAQRAGLALPNGTLSFDSWNWVWNASGVPSGNYSVCVLALAGKLVSLPVSSIIQVQPIGGSGSGNGGSNGHGSGEFINGTDRSNHRPQIISVLPQERPRIFENGQMSFKVSASDPDGDLLAYFWFMDKAPLMPSDDPTMMILKASYSFAGPHEIMVRVTDGHADNGTVSYTWDLRVLDGFQVEDLTRFEHQFLPSGEAQPISVSVLDPEGGKIFYLWTVDGQQDRSCMGPSYDFRYESMGTAASYHTVTLKVQNEYDQTKELRWRVLVDGRSVQGTAALNKRTVGLEGLAVNLFMIGLFIGSLVFVTKVLARTKQVLVPPQAPQVCPPVEPKVPPQPKAVRPVVFTTNRPVLIRKVVPKGPRKDSKTQVKKAPLERPKEEPTSPKIVTSKGPKKTSGAPIKRQIQCPGPPKIGWIQRVLLSRRTPSPLKRTLRARLEMVEARPFPVVRIRKRRSSSRTRASQGGAY